jgi:hypothetical protein
VKFGELDMPMFSGRERRREKRGIGRLRDLAEVDDLGPD